MRKEVYIDDENIKIIEHKRKFLLLKTHENIITYPIHLIRNVQRAYREGLGTESVAIMFETDDEEVIIYDEVDDIDMVFNLLLELKERTNDFVIELYNIDTQETIVK